MPVHSAARGRLLVAFALALPPGTLLAMETVTISTADCRRLVEHAPHPDVGLRPGMDVRGRSVAPADLPGSLVQGTTPDTLTIQIAINPLPHAAANRFTETTADVAVVEYDVASGHFRLNGQPLPGSAERALSQACQRALSRPDAGHGGTSPER